MCRLARENLTANLLRFVDTARPVQTACLNGEIGNTDARRAEGKGLWPACGLPRRLLTARRLFDSCPVNLSNL